MLAKTKVFRMEKTNDVRQKAFFVVHILVRGLKKANMAPALSAGRILY
jgi:hypothetical protein